MFKLEDGIKNLDDVSLALDEIKKYYKKPKTIHRRTMNWIMGKIKFFYTYETIFTTEGVDLLLRFYREFQGVKGPTKFAVERYILSTIEKIVYDTVDYFLDPYSKRKRKAPRCLDPKLIDSTKDAKKKEEYRTLLIIANFCMEIYRYKMDRDSFSGERKMHALTILEAIMREFEFPGGMELALESLSHKKKDVVSAAHELLVEYYSSRNSAPNKKMIKKLEVICQNAKFRNTVVGSLDVLVRTNVLLDLEASDKLDEWEEKKQTTRERSF